MRLTRMHQIGARAPDLDETRRFYEQVLRARHIATFDPPGLLFFDFAGVRLLFERETKPATLYFWVDDIDAAYAALTERGVKFEDEPHLVHRDTEGTFDNPNTEEWMAFFRDPGENIVAIASRR